MLETYTNQTNTITLTEIKKKAVGTQLIATIVLFVTMARK